MVQDFFHQTVSLTAHWRFLRRSRWHEERMELMQATSFQHRLSSEPPSTTMIPSGGFKWPYSAGISETLVIFNCSLTSALKSFLMIFVHWGSISSYLPCWAFFVSGACSNQTSFVTDSAVSVASLYFWVNPIASTKCQCIASKLMMIMQFVSSFQAKSQNVLDSL